MSKLFTDIWEGIYVFDSNYKNNRDLDILADFKKKVIEFDSSNSFFDHHIAKITTLVKDFDFQVEIPEPDIICQGFQEIIQDLERKENILDKNYFCCESYAYNAFLFELYNQNLYPDFCNDKKIGIITLSNLIKNQDNLTFTFMAKSKNELANNAQAELDKFSNSKAASMIIHEKISLSGRIINNPEIREVTTKSNQTKNVLNVTLVTGKNETTSVSFWDDKAESLKDTLKKGALIKIDAHSPKMGENYVDEKTKETWVQKFATGDSLEIVPTKEIDSFMNIIESPTNSNQYYDIKKQGEITYFSVKGYIHNGEYKQNEAGEEIPVTVPGSVSLNDSNQIGKDQINSIIDVIHKEKLDPEKHVVRCFVKGEALIAPSNDVEKNPYFLNIQNLNKQKNAKLIVTIDLKKEYKQKLEAMVKESQGKSKSKSSPEMPL